MDPKPANSGSTAIYWVISIVLLVAIVGGAAWMYVNTPKLEQATDTTTEQQSSDPVLGSSKDIDNSVSEIDTELASIDEDLSSTDDDDPTL